MLSNYPFRSFEFWPCEEAGQWHRQEPELHLFHISVLNVVCTLHELNAWASLLSTVSPAPEPVYMVSITWSGLLPLAALQRTKWPLGCITRHIHARTHTFLILILAHHLLRDMSTHLATGHILTGTYTQTQGHVNNTTNYLTACTNALFVYYIMHNKFVFSQLFYLVRLKHKNIVKLYGAYPDKKKVLYCLSFVKSTCMLLLLLHRIVVAVHCDGVRPQLTSQR